jgi:nucleoid-associated protein YgaU
MVLGILVSRARCALAWGVVTSVAAMVVAGVLPVLGEAATAVRHGTAAGNRFDTVLVWGSAAVAVGVTGWLWLVASVVLTDAARGVRRRRRGVPDVVRRGVLLLCGAALTGGFAAPAWSDAGGPSGPEVLRGLRLPERAQVTSTPAPRAAVPVSREHRATVVVAPGDTLWAIAAERLEPGASVARVAEAWPRLYELNRDVIGPDPGHLEPGQRLLLPQDPA